MQRDKDRVRLVVAAAENFRFTTKQVIELVEMQHCKLYQILLVFSHGALISNSVGDAKNQTAILLYPQLLDGEEDKFDDVLACFRFDEDKTEIKEALGLD